MIKKIILFLLLTVACFGQVNKVRNIKDLYAKVKENTKLNGDNIYKEYTIKYIASDYLRKEVILPKINKGEIYQYENNKRFVYIPLFNEVNEESGKDEFNNFLTILNELKDKDLKKIKELKLKDGYLIKIVKFKNINNFLLPVKLDIYDGTMKISSLELEDIKVNSGLVREGL